MGPLLGAETRKLFSSRLRVWLLLAAVAITALYVSLTLAFADDPETWTYPMTTPEGQRTLFAIAAGGASPLVAVLSAIGMTSENRHRTATTTFLATPHRGHVVAAKLVTYALVGAGFAAACLVVVGTIAVPWLASDGVSLSLTENGLRLTVAGVLASGALHGLVGVGLGALLRDQVATVVGLLVYLFVVEPILTQVSALRDWTVYLLGPADDALTSTALRTQDFLAPWQGGLVLAAYALVVGFLGVLLTTRRDVT